MKAMLRLLSLFTLVIAIAAADARPRGLTTGLPLNNFNGGGAQINTNVTSYYYNMHRDLNYWSGGGEQKIVSSLNGTLQGKAAWDALGASGQPYFNPTTGELATPVQTDVTAYCRGLFTDPSVQSVNPAPNGIFGPPNVGSSGPQGKWWLGQVWNLEWSGTISTAGTKITNNGSFGTGGSPGFGAVGSCGTNCATATFGNATGASNFEVCFVIDASNRNDPPRSQKFYPSQFVTQARSADLATSLINPDWLVQYITYGKSGVGKIRWMDPIGANFSAITDFSQLAEYTFNTYSAIQAFSGGNFGQVFPPGYNGTYGPKGGIGPQTICTYSNKIGAHAHFTMPYAFTTSAALSLGQAFDGCMNQGLIVDFEYCNEVWNTGIGFACYRYGRRQPYPPLGPSAPYQQAVTINSITTGATTTINVTSNSYTNGQLVAFSIPNTNTIATALDASGTNAAGPFTVGSAGGTSFTVPVNTTGLSYTSGGTVYLIDPGAVSWAGYRSAQLMDQIYAAYGASKRSRWRGILGGSFNSNSGDTLQAAITGAQFFASNESTGTGACAPRKCLWELFDEGQVAPYAGNGAYNGTPVQGIQTNSATPTVNATGHTFVNGQVIRCYASTGMTQINNLTGTVSGAAANVFTLNINTTGFSPWVTAVGNFCVGNALPKAADDSVALNISTPGTYPTKYSYFAEQMSDSTINGTSVSNPSFGYVTQSSGNYRSATACPNCLPGLMLTNALVAKRNGLKFGEYEAASAAAYFDQNGQYFQTPGNAAANLVADMFLNWQYDAGTATKGPADIQSAHVAAGQAAGVGYASTYLEMGIGPGAFSGTRYAGDAYPGLTRTYTRNAAGPYVEPYTPPAWTASYAGNATNRLFFNSSCNPCTDTSPANTVVIGTAATTVIFVATLTGGTITSATCDGVTSTTPKAITTSSGQPVAIFMLSVGAGSNARTCSMVSSGSGFQNREFYVAAVSGLQSTTPVSVSSGNPNGTFPINYTGGNLLVAASVCGGSYANTSGVSTPTAANPVTQVLASDSDSAGGHTAQFALMYAPFTSPIFSVAPGCNFSAVGATFNFLLKRDLDPAANDNSPMWLEKAA